MLRITEYLEDPCRVSSIPYWKALQTQIPENMRIVHEAAFSNELLEAYVDEPYFRLKRDLTDFAPAQLPAGFSLCQADCKEYAQHINHCYFGFDISEGELKSYLQRRVYCRELWLAVRENATGEIVATGIAELDREIGEGILEWIQVSPQYRGRGLGQFLVQELLCRMSPNADFATVSGQCNNPTFPERLYRRCGFAGSDVWHVLRRKDP